MFVGSEVGMREGDVGTPVGGVVGLEIGDFVGSVLGSDVGTSEGEVGITLGSDVGKGVGFKTGTEIVTTMDEPVIPFVVFIINLNRPAVLGVHVKLAVFPQMSTIPSGGVNMALIEVFRPFSSTDTNVITLSTPMWKV